MKRLIFIITLVVMFSGGAFAQFSERSRLGCINGTQTLLPNSSNTNVGAFYYVYTQNSTPQGSFSQVERSSNLTLKKVDLNTGYLVTDFVIHDGRIYFTGNHNNATGYVGWFNIDSVFNGNGTIHYYLFKYTSQTPIFSLYSYKNFQKIKVFTDGNNIHAVVLGTRFTNLFSSSEYYYCLMDYQLGASSFTYAYSTYFPEHFEDIAITNSAVVTAARKGDDGAGNVFMRMFPKTSFSLSSPSGDILYFPNNQTISDVHLQSASSSSDTFFTVYYSEKYTTSGLVCQGLRINCFKTTTSLGITPGGGSTIVTNQGTTLSSACKIWGTTYSPLYRRLLVLQNMDAPVSPDATVSAVCRFLHSGSGVSFDRAIYLNGLSYGSISAYSTHNWITCGLQNQTVDVLIEDWGNIGTFTCATHNTSITTTSNTITINTDTYALTTGTNAVTHYTSTPAVIPSIYMEDCLQQLTK